MAFNYAGDPSVSDVAAVRFEIQDTDSAAPLLTDAEVSWAILSETGTAAGEPATISQGPLFASAARCLEALARNFAAQADTETGTLKVTYSKQATTYAERAKELRSKASGYYAPYAGGQSRSEKEGWEDDDDKIGPLFRRKQFDSPYTGGDLRDRGALPPMPD